MKMKYCISCGKKIDKKTKYCLHCGKNLEGKEAQHKEQPKKTQKTPIITISIFFIVILGLIIIFLTQSSSNEDVNANKILPRELSDSLVDVITPSDSGNNKQPQVKREGYSLDEKPFDDRNYAYDERTKDFRLVCTTPCPVSKSVLDQEFAAISYAVSTARGLTKSDIDKSLLPFEVHASKDDVCPRIPGALAYMSGYFVDGNGYSRGKLCFFFDELYYNRDKFPYSTSIHEVMHLFESNKVPHDAGVGGSVLWEGLSEMMESFFLKGNERDSFCWKGNAWYKDVLKNSQDSHWVGGDLFFELCNQYGFDYNNLPELFDELDKRDVDERGFVDIINSIVGADTSYLFRNAGVI